MLISNLDVRSFDVLLEGMIDEIPNFKLKKDNEFGFTSTNLANKIDPVIIGNQLSTGISEIFNDQDQQYLFEDVDQICLLLSEKMINIKNTIFNDIAPTVEKLHTQINDKYQSILESEGVTDFEENKPEFSNYYKKLSWVNSMLMNMSELDIAKLFHEKLNIQSQTLDIQNLNYANDFLFEAKEVIIEPKQTDELIEHLNEDAIIADGETNGEILLKYLTSPSTYNVLQNTIFYSFKDSNISKVALNLNNILPKLIKTVELIEKYPLDLSKKSEAALQFNLEHIKNLNLSCMYYILLCKHKYFKNKLMIDETHINKEEFKSFEREGYSFENIYMHMKINYITPNVPVPVQGISTSTMIDKAKYDHEAYLSWKINQKKNLQNIQTGAIRKAYTRTLQEYIKNIPEEYIPKYLSHFDFVKQSEFTINSTAAKATESNNNVVDFLYDFVCDIQYKDTIIPKVIKNFRTELINISESYGQVKDEHFNLAMVSVMSDLIIDFALSEFIEK